MLNSAKFSCFYYSGFFLFPLALFSLILAYFFVFYNKMKEIFRHLAIKRAKKAAEGKLKGRHTAAPFENRGIDAHTRASPVRLLIYGYHVPLRHGHAVIEEHALHRRHGIFCKRGEVLRGYAIVGHPEICHPALPHERVEHL